MFMTAGLVAIVVILKFLIGSVIGLVVAALIYRSRLGVWLAFRAALLAGVAFVVTSGIAGWAGLHASFQNGLRVDVAPWGEDLRLRNRIANNELMLCVAASSIAALLAGVRPGRRHRIN